MTQLIRSARLYFLREVLAAVAAVALLANCAMADSNAKTDSTPSGQVEFDCPGLPEASVEFDLSHGMFKTLFSLGDAAIAGTLDGLKKAIGSEDSSEDAQTMAEQIQIARQVVELVGDVVQGVRVRVYEDGESVSVKDLSAHYGKKLRDQNWETVVRMRDGEEYYSVNVLRDGNAIKGLFIVVHDEDSTVLANVICDVSPENVRKLASAASSAGAKVSLDGDSNFNIMNFLIHAECVADPPPAPVGD